MSVTTTSEGTQKLTTQYVEHSGGTLAYTDYGGDGELVLMLPGMGSLRSSYRFLAPILREAGYHPVAMDLRGQGDTSVPWDRYDVPSVGGDIIAVIEHLGAGPAHIIANSYSPAPAIWAAAECPEMVRSLALISTFARDTKPGIVMKALTWFMMNNPWRPQTWRMYYSSLYVTQKPPDFQEYLDALTANVSQPGRFDAVKSLPAAPRGPWVERLAKVQARTLVVMGSKDPDFPDPAEEGQYLAEKLSGRLVMIEGAGHYPQAEMPEQTGKAILEFLGER